MPHFRPRAALLVAIIASLVLTPGALGASAAGSKGAAKAKERAYGKHCGSKRKGSARSRERARCVDAMARIATGRSSSPAGACRALSRRKAKGQPTSAFTRCVRAGAKLMNAKRRAGDVAEGDDAGADDADHGGEADDDAGADDVEPGDPTADATGGEPDPADDESES